MFASLAKRLTAGPFTPDFSLDVTLRCEPGVTVLFGASGAGKTLTLDLLAGLARPEKGRILLGGEILFDAQRGVHVPPRSRGIGYVFQNEALFPHMTVEENLLFPLQKLGPLERRRRSHSLLETFRIAGLAARYPRELSGGEKQRASLARALAGEPRLLLLDEPARGLDYELRRELYGVLREVRARYHIPIVLVTHDMAESFLLGDRMYVYNAGSIVQEGRPEEVLAAPRDRRVAQLLGFTNLFEGAVEQLDPGAGRSRLRTPHFAVTVDYLPGRLLGDRIGFCISSQQVRLISEPRAGEVENSLEADLVHEILTPSTVRLFFRPVSGPQPAQGAGLLPASASSAGLACAEPAVELECEMTRSSYQELGVAAKKRWTLSLPRAAVYVFKEADGRPA